MVNVTRSEWSMYTVHCILYIVQVKNGVVQETWARSDDSFKLLFHVKNCQNCQKLTKLSIFFSLKIIKINCQSYQNCWSGHVSSITLWGCLKVE